VSWSLLRHPLLIAAFTALVTAIVVPQLARHWQDRQKELELKQDLLGQIATTSTTAVRQGISLVNGQNRAAGGESNATPDDETYTLLRSSWLIDRARARSAIITYFPDLEPCWYSYERLVADFLGLVDRSPRTRAARVSSIRRYVESDMSRSYVDPAVPDGCRPIGDLPDGVRRRYDALAGEMARKKRWDALIAADGGDSFTEKGAFRGAYAVLGELLLIGKDRIIESIDAADGRGFDTGWFDE
jgi:hypothetical protein